MNAGGRGKARRGGVLRLGAQSLRVRDVEVNGVDRRASVLSCTEEHLGTSEAGEVAVVAAFISARASAEGGEQILGAPHQGDRWAGRGDGRGLEDALGRFAQGDDTAARQGLNLLAGLSL